MEMNTVLYLPDGNRRFARKKSISLAEAYLLGGKSLRLFSEFFVAGNRAKRVIYYATSDYTCERLDGSLEVIYEAAKKTLKELLEEKFFINNGIRFIAIDHSRKLPSELKKVATDLSDSTINLNNGEVIVLWGYSLEKDINTALSQNPRTFQEFRRSLLFPEDIDLVIRPFEMRISKGPVYAMAQAQMITLDKLNPEVKKEDLEEAVREYCRLRSYRINKSFNPHHKLNNTRRENET